jgi:hypothetical protein
MGVTNMIDQALFKMTVLQFIKEHAERRAEQMRDMFLTTESLVADGVDLKVAIDAQHFAHGNPFGLQEEFTAILEEAQL